MARVMPCGHWTRSCSVAPMSKSGKHGGGFFDAEGVAHHSSAFVKRRDKARAKAKNGRKANKARRQK